MNWLDTLKTLAPTVATALGGPLAGAAVAAIGDALGVSGATQETIGKLFKDGQITSEQLAEIRKLEIQYQNEEKERGFKYAELEFKSVDSARAMQTATQSKMPAVLTVLITLGFFLVLGLLFFRPELKGNEIVMVMVGQLSAVWGGCITFYFGTTFGSQGKNVLLANAGVK